MTDTKLREATKKKFNGEYAIWICRCCEAFETDSECGNADDALIYNQCSRCSTED